MTLSKAIIEKIDEQVKRSVTSGFTPFGFWMGKDLPFDSIPPRLLHQALLDYLPKLSDELPTQIMPVAGGVIIHEIGREDWIRDKLVSLGRLGLCMGMVEQALGCDPAQGWDLVPFTNIKRLQGKKSCRTDLRALGQIQRDAPQLFRLAVGVEGNPEVVSANILIFLMSTLQKHHKTKTGILGRAELNDLSWAVVGLVQQCGKEELPVAGMRAAFCAQYLMEEGIDIPAINVDESLLEMSSEEKKGRPTPQAWSALRRSMLAYKSQNAPSPRQAKKPEF